MEAEVAFDAIFLLDIYYVFDMVENKLLWLLHIDIWDAHFYDLTFCIWLRYLSYCS